MYHAGSREDLLRVAISVELASGGITTGRRRYIQQQSSIGLARDRSPSAGEKKLVERVASRCRTIRGKPDGSEP